MKNRSSWILVFWILGITLFAQDVEKAIDSSLAIDTLMNETDSTIIATPPQITDTEFVPDTVIADPASPYGTGIDSIYISRLAAIVSPIEFPYNDKVKSLINFYTGRKRELVEGMLGLSEYYFPMFEAELDAAGLPLELKYLPIIESALNPRAFSRAGASGLWQFMYGTGKLYGLTQTSYIDDRRDPEKSTKAAVRFLKDLYGIYGDWYLVIAAYNCGPGNVNKAIKRSGGKRDYWEIYPYLPKETRGYAPAFIAAAYVMNYYEEHGLQPRRSSLPLATDTLSISRPLHFEQISRITQVPIETLRDLNPQYKRDVIPAEKKPYGLRVPFLATNTFIAYEDSIYNLNRKVYFPNDRLVAMPAERGEYIGTTPKGKSKVYYTIQTGDALGTIATWYNVSANDLRYWNNVSGNKIRAGQKLVVFVPNNKLTHYQKVNSLTLEEKQALIGKPVPTTIAKEVTPFTPTTGTPVDYYVVRRGDNLWSIAKKFPGVTNSDLMNWNALDSSSKLNVGQKLKIYKKI